MCPRLVVPWLCKRKGTEPRVGALGGLQVNTSECRGRGQCPSASRRCGQPSAMVPVPLRPPGRSERRASPVRRHAGRNRVPSRPRRPRGRGKSLRPSLRAPVFLATVPARTKAPPPRNDGGDFRAGQTIAGSKGNAILASEFRLQARLPSSP